MQRILVTGGAGFLGSHLCERLLDGVILVMNWRGGAGKIVDLIHLQIDLISDVMADHFEMGIAHEVEDILFAARKIIIQAEDFTPRIKKPLA